MFHPTELLVDGGNTSTSNTYRSFSTTRSSSILDHLSSSDEESSDSDSLKHLEYIPRNPNWRFMQPSEMSRVLIECLPEEFNIDITRIISKFTVDRNIKVQTLVYDEYKRIVQRGKDRFRIQKFGAEELVRDKLSGAFLNDNSDYVITSCYAVEKSIIDSKNEFPKFGNFKRIERGSYAGDIFKWDDLYLVLKVRTVDWFVGNTVG